MIASSFVEDACAIAHRVRSRELSATGAALAAIQRIEKLNPPLNCFTAVLRDRALSQARDLDRRIAIGDDPGPLAGVPFAVKNLFDVAGITTLAGSKINAERPPATRDATVIERLKQAGAILMGALNMDEYAYGFTTENVHYGVTRNPHDTQRVAGGSSGGSASAVAAGMVPLSLGSDTNGSIRVPAAFCGVFGLKPTYGAISRAGAFLFVPSLDHIGLLTRSVRDLALAFDLLRGPDPRDPGVSDAPQSACAPELSEGIDGLRIAVAEGYFASLGLPEAFSAVAKAAHALSVNRTVTIPDAEKARAAADIITPCESANLHLNHLRSRPQDFDPAVLERFLTGALLPAAWYLQAQRFRGVFREKMRHLFETVDVILAPTTPCAAIRTGQPTTTVDGLGRFTEPLSFIGLPVVSVPVFEPGQLPLGVQLIGAPRNESAVLRVASHLEALGVARAPVVSEIAQ
jgi:AtzE family amidohydrolase